MGAASVRLKSAMREGDRQRAPAWEFKGIQALRAVAAFAVVLGHSMNYLGRGHGTVPGVLTEFQGAVGVDLFFVISGFVMAISSGRLLRQPHPTRVFLWRRVLRVVPLYWLLTAVKLVILAALPRFDVTAWRPSVWNAVSSFLFIPSVNGMGEIRPVITLGWTLNFEMMFYLLFAISLVWRERFVRLLVPLVVLLAAIGLVRTAAWPIWTAGADPVVVEFAAGVVIALLFERGRMPGTTGSAVLLVAGAAGLSLIRSGPFLLREVSWGVPAAMVVLGVVGLERAVGDRLPRWLLLLGSASYAVYLVQTFVFPVVDLLAERVRGIVGLTPLEVGAVVMLGSLGISAALGLGVHLLIERPMTDVLKRRFGVERISPIAREG